MSTKTVDEIGIDLDKFWSVIRKNILWILLIFLFTNLIAYLVIRWTKPLFESESILRLDVQEEANLLGLAPFQDAPENLLAGEIELIQSKLFLNRIIDFLDLKVSYYAAGNVLNDEKFGSAPIQVDVNVLDDKILDQRIYVEIIDEFTYKAGFGSESALEDSPIYKWDQRVSWPGMTFRLYLTKTYDPSSEVRVYFFVVNSRDALLKYLQANLIVEPDKELAKTIRIAYQDKSATKAQEIVASIDSLYLQYSEQKNNQENEQKIAWLNDELSKIEKQLEGYENYIEKFTIENRTSDLNEDLKNVLVLMNELDSQRYNFTSRIRQIDKLSKDVKSGEADFIDLKAMELPDYMGEELDALNELLRRRERLELSYRESTLAIQQLDESIKSARESILGRLSALRDRFVTDLEQVEKTKARLEQEFTSLPGKSNEFNKNKRFYDLYEEFYLSLLQSKAEFEIARAGSNTDYEILSPASTPESPISPNVYLIHGVGAVAGFMLSILFIGVSYLANNKINNLSELEKLTPVSILGSVPTANVVLNTSQLIVHKHPKSAVSESLRSIRTNIQFMTSKKEKNIISVTSTIGGEGKTFISVNLGGIISVTKKRVIVLDLDMRKPRVHLSFGDANEEKGISTILIHKYDYKECIRKTELEYLDYIPAGPTPPNPSELLLSAEFKTLLDHLSAEYDMVILDSPPIGLVTDGIIIMERADLSLYIIRSGYSKKEFVETLNRVNKEENLHSKIAVILNAMPKSGSSSYGYGYYHDGKHHTNAT
ncbi:polysaccharide biosynthesis tyrosine autokinase [Fulvivirga sedimenti]|uniref:non-specific protein-tyrosine kinase n=1 Tax=Fulvivirga sedimenti TaxID=2879465 RepID=A0A9X1HU45_9BACT|nr:polysaccharide biosynthesis tyrosine autokinase [Fulvivirga sedimenti]MCA6077955.1 polysaccharide biosynthesis tyrosine autokinase [Fulvivirga sedimenti]